MEYNWGEIKSLIQDKMRSAAFTSNNPSEILRAFNLGLDRINTGDTGERNQLEVAYQFQKKITNVSYSTTTGHDYAFTTLSINSNTFKFPSDLRINTNEDVHFEEVSPRYWFKEHGVFGSIKSIYAITFNGNVRTLKILHDTTETLNFEYFTTDMILDDDGSTRGAHIDGKSDSDTLLIPDEWIDIPLNFGVSELYGIKKGYNDIECLRFEQKAQTRLKTMINTLGVRRQSPQRIWIRSEWNRGLIRVKRG